MVDIGNLVRAGEPPIVVITQISAHRGSVQPAAAAPARRQRRQRQGRAWPSRRSTPTTGRVIDNGILQVVDNQVDQTTGTVRMKASFPNADCQLWPGQFVNVRLFISTIPHAVVVPTAAVQRGPNGAYVYVARPR